MKELFDIKIQEKISQKSKKMLITYFILTGIVFLAVVGIIIYFAGEPYGSPKEKTLKIIMCVIISLAVLCSYLFFMITYGRTKSYATFLYDSIKGRKTTTLVTVLELNEKKEDLKNLSFYSVEVLEWDEKKQEYFKRRVLIDAEISIDEIKKDLVKDAILEIQTISNVLYAYEVKN